MAVGALLGWQFPWIAGYAAPIANSFLRLVQSVIAPVLFTTLVASFARGGRPSELGRIGLKSLVWFEGYDDLQDARRRELQIKEWKRAWKIRLIEEENLDWDDLYPTLFEPGYAGPGPRPSPGSEIA